MASIKSVSKMPVKKMGRPVGSSAVKSDAVARVRAAKGWTQMQMAVELKCSMSSIHKFETKSVLPSHGPLLDRFNDLAKSVSVEVPS